MRRFATRAFVLVFACFSCLAICQADELAAVTGLVTDPNGRSVPGVNILIINLATNVASKTVTNDQGIYRVPSLQPGIYRITLDKDGFKSIVKSGVELHVQDVASINFELQIGSVNETVTVEAGGLVINTTDATVSTVVDRQFAENLPLNGRSFQTLIELTPGVVLTASNATGDSGQFSVNGQRAAANYWMVDGVSANIGIGVNASNNSAGNGLSGSLGSFSALGGTNSLVSVDALQEFRIQTSTYAPEFGRTPGGQISIVTRSGTNQFHGTAFDYLRNDIFDANDWFANQKGVAKPRERQNDFGGTFSGPVVKDKTFFFFSYEGLRLRLPQVALTNVPDTNPDDPFSRQFANPPMQPFLNAYPQPNGPEVLDPSGNHQGVAQFNASYSNPATLDAYSIRIDHKLTDKLVLFGRYNYSPSEFVSRGGPSGGGALSFVQPSRITIQTATVGTTWMISPTVSNDLRFNYTRANSESHAVLDSFGGAIPLTSLPFPLGIDGQNGQFSLSIFSLVSSTGGAALFAGQQGKFLQRQINLVDNLSLQKGSHSIKFGVDFRRLSPLAAPVSYLQFAAFRNMQSALTGRAFEGLVFHNADTTFLFRNLGAFAQDTWHSAPRLTLTYGLRWDLDFAPSSLSGSSIPAVTGYSLNDFSQFMVAQAGTPPFKTTYGNVAPRIGMAYQLSQSQDWQTVLRGGFGVFYDLVSSETGNAVGNGFPPFAAFRFIPPNPPSTFPFNSGQIDPPKIPPTGTLSQLYAFNPNLKLPYTLEWNVALEQAMGKAQTLSFSYIGAAGRRLLQTTSVLSPPTNPNLSGFFVDNTATSDYDALQIQCQRRLSHGLQALASYTWAHSIDTGSAGSSALASNLGLPGSNPNENRGPSDFDIRNAFSAGLTYDIPAPKSNGFTNAILRGWSTENIIQVRSAPPVNITDGDFFNFDDGIFTGFRPDLVLGQPLYLNSSHFPGGRAFNPAAFTAPPVDPTTGNPLRQGTLPRNFLRGFGATQWDFAVHRDFPIHEPLHLRFRAEMFNVLNHPNFAPPNSSFTTPTQPSFGVSAQMLGQYLNGGGMGSNLGGGGFSPLYQFGGPRSIQFGLKLLF